MSELKYQRLTSFAIGVNAFYSLRLGPDHLLSVSSSGYTEKYKRFYFRDIQVITIQKTKRRFIWNWILGTIAILCFAEFSFLFFRESQFDRPEIIFILIMAVVFGIPLLLNNLFGETCACQLRTAVQIEELPSLRRVRKAQKVLEKIRPLILAAQASVPSSAFQVPGSEAPATLNPELPPTTLNPEL